MCSETIYSTVEEKICDYCEKTIPKKQFYIRDTFYGDFCSKKCYDESYARDWEEHTSMVNGGVRYGI